MSIRKTLVIRKTLLLELEEEIIIYHGEGELKLKTFKDSLMRPRQLVKQYNKEDLNIVSLLLDERRENTKDVGEVPSPSHFCSLAIGEHYIPY